MQTATITAMVKRAPFPWLPIRSRGTPPRGGENRAQCPPVDTGQQVDAYERQFRRAGLPMFVEGFSASTDVFTRAAPVLGLVFVGESLGAGNLDWTRWQNLLA